MSQGMLIGEIGASSSRWAWLAPDGGTITLPPHGEGLPGFNPVNGDAALFASGIRAGFTKWAPDAALAPRVVVYGAGCGSEPRARVMEQALAGVWPRATIDVKSDLLGAARGLCSVPPALVLILGTGMNAGHFDGERLRQPMPSLGYVLGDEGSGADIGRTLLQDAFYRRMPDPIAVQLFGPSGPALGTIIEEVYRSPFPARALAARTALLAPLRQEPYVRDLVFGRFHALMDLLKTFFTAEQRAQVCATGSVAWGFREELAECMLEHGMDLIAVERDPLHGLVALHRNEGAA